MDQSKYQRVLLFLLIILHTEILTAQNNSQPTSNLPLSRLLINSTVKLESLGPLIRDSGVSTFQSTGTAFFYEFKVDSFLVPVLVTNHHVVRNTSITQLVFTESDSNQPKNGSLIEFDNDNSRTPWISHPRYDLAILPLTDVMMTIKSQFKKEIFFIPFVEVNIPDDSTMDSLSAIEELLMLGYPKGYGDSKNNYPIVRRGTTATPVFSNFNGRNEFLLDIPIYSGSSGSPVVLFDQGSYSSGNGLVTGNRLLLLGIATQSIDIKNQQIIEQHGIDNPLNIAVVIKASALLDFKPILSSWLKQQQASPKSKNNKSGSSTYSH